MKTLAQALGSKSFTVIAEIPLRGHAPAEEVRQRARELAPFVDGILVAENPQQRGQLSPTAQAAMLLDEGIDPVTQLNCRDHNRLALHRELVGLRALGVSSLLLNRGNRLQTPGGLAGTPVFEVNCRELIAMAAGIGEEQPGVAGREFLLGTGATVFSPRADWKAGLLKTRASAGARFLVTQPCFSVSILRRYMQRLVDLRLTWNFAVIVTLAPLPGMHLARWQFEDARDTLLPRNIVEQLAAADDPERAGIELCARQMQEIATIPGVSGVNLMTLGNPSAVVAAIEASGLRPPR